MHFLEEAKDFSHIIDWLWGTENLLCTEYWELFPHG
jgi:hypothetical protein